MILKKNKKIDESKIMCDDCNKTNKSNSYENSFFVFIIVNKIYALYVNQNIIKHII